jgi:hypothetical protein
MLLFPASIYRVVLEHVRVHIQTETGAVWIWRPHAVDRLRELRVPDTVVSFD